MFKNEMSLKHNILLPVFVCYRFSLYRIRFYVLVFHVCRMTLDAVERLKFTHLLGTIYSLFLTLPVIDVYLHGLLNGTSKSVIVVLLRNM